VSDFDRARALIREYKGDNYIFGPGVLGKVGPVVASLGTRTALIYDVYPDNEKPLGTIRGSLASAGVQLVKEIEGARPNVPRDDLARITEELRPVQADVVVCFGGGSTIDAAKAASMLCSLDGTIEDYFGVGKVTEALQRTGKKLRPVVALQTAASTGAHLSKGSNITDFKTGQKKLVVDEALIPPKAIFDYDLSMSMPRHFTADGALDGVAHMLEVLFDSTGKPYHGKMMEVAEVGIRLIVAYLEQAMEAPCDVEARTALGLGTDLGGYATGLGGTNGAHLNSFSLVDILTHGRACAIMNPYYTVFFAPAVEESLRMVGKIYQDAGFADSDIASLKGRELGEAVARAMVAFSKRIGFPTALGEVPGFTQAHIERALSAAKDPALRMKLENMPVPMSAETVDEYMGPILEAAKTGDLSLIKNAY
jgi:alcohol dehydrogenase